MPFLKKKQFVHKNKVTILSLYICTKLYDIQIWPKHKSVVRSFLGKVMCDVTYRYVQTS